MTKARGMMPIPFLIAILGVLFAVWNSWDGGSVLCLTAGCSLYRQFTVAGFSLWWAGAGLFSLLAVLSLTGFSVLGRLVAGLGLAADCLLLLIMLLTLPCLSCLAAALLLALCYRAFRTQVLHARRNRKEPGCSRLLFVWIVLFVINLGLVVRSGFEPWPIRTPEGDEPAAVGIFFSPSCGACRETVKGMSEAVAARAAWYPVAETPEDFPILLALSAGAAQSDRSFRTAFEEALATPEPSLFELLRPGALLLQFRLWLNQAHVLAAGRDRLPFIEFHGLPAALLRRNVRPNSGGSHLSLPLDLDVAGSCGHGEDCP